jgi:Flp pilus assembly protein TadG
MRYSIRLASVTVGLLLAACGRQSTMDDQMRQDLEAASASTMELAPTGGGQRVVSAIEQTGKVQPRVTKSRQAEAPALTKKPETPQTVQQAASGPAATRPSQRPAVSPPPPGGYKTIGEVLRNAPFPIKP